LLFFKLSDFVPDLCEVSFRDGSTTTAIAFEISLKLMVAVADIIPLRL
jgi:hypothetical protein